MTKTIVQIPAFRLAMKALGLRVRITTYSSFAKARVFDGATAINDGNVHSPAHHERYRDFYTWSETHTVRDGEFIIIT